jgi:nitroimidazol reductase NimA-like FMN-containing flavoprotein (pyridoxamine 5'-phosphate oxidase superfamily)
MSTAPDLRRSDRAMSGSEISQALSLGYCGRVTTVGQDGWPYCMPTLYVVLDEDIYVHGTAARGHFRNNVDQSDKACFEIDEPGEVFPYGRFECDTTLAYRSVIAFGRIRVVDDITVKQRFFDALMHKYANNAWQRPPGFYPRMDGITLYAISVERVAGKQIRLPSSEQQWPSRDRTMTPDATRGPA